MLIAKTKKILSNFLISDYSMILITLFFIIYSLFSSNVPKILEIEHFFMIIIIILLLFIYFFEHIKLNLKQYLKNNILAFIFLGVITYGFFIGLYNNNSDKNILRDLFGVSSILSIFILIYFRDKNPKYINFLFKVLVYTGFIFSIKTLIFYYIFLDHSNYPSGNPVQVAKYHFLYLENTIILSLVFFLLKIYDHTEKKNLISMVKYCVLLYFPLSVASIYSLRGPILFTFLIFIVFLTIKKKSFNGLIFSIFFLINSFFVLFIFIIYPLYYFIFHSKKILIYTIGSFFFLFFILDHIYLWSAELSSLTHNNILFDHKIKKFDINFLNNRQGEFSVFNENFTNFHIFFGKGLGALISNPVNNSNVLFFHNFSLYYFYKMGIVGVILIIFIFFFIVNKSLKIFFNFKNIENIDKNIYISLLATLGYPLLLSATYKSISFGFILALFLIIKLNYNDAKNI